MALVYDPFIGGIRWTWAPGAGIDMSGGTISVITPPEGVPYVAGPGISIYGATVSNTTTGDGRVERQGDAFTFNPSADIVDVSGASVTIVPDTAYKIFATSGPVTINATPPAAGKWAYDGHLEIFVASTGYVVTGTNVVLSQPLEPDAVNNCTVRFHDGIAIISVEDHIAGYVVTVTSGTTAGTLPYALSSATQEYIAFDATTEGSLLDMAGVATNGEKHIVGNGYTQTILSGGVSCTSKTTFSNLGMNGVSILGGTATLGDVFIPQGGTLNVNGGGLAVEKVTGSGTIDLGGLTRIALTRSNQSATLKDVSIVSGSGGNAGGIYATAARLTAERCTFAANNGGGVYLGSSSEVIGNFSSCVFSGNTGNGVFVNSPTSAHFEDCTFSENTLNAIRLEGSVFFGGENVIDGTVSGTTGKLTISSGASIDLTGNTNTTPIAPGGGITFEAGGATVQLGSTAGTVESSYMMDNVILPAGAKLTNTAVVDLNSAFVSVSSGMTASASGCAFVGGRNAAAGGNMIASSGGIFVASNCVFSGGSATIAGGFDCNTSASATLNNCTISGNSASAAGGGVAITAGGVMTLNNCTVVGNVCTDTLAGKDLWTNLPVTINGGTYGDCAVQGDAVLELAGNITIEKIYTRYLQTGGSVTISSGASIDLTGNTNATPIAPSGGIAISSGGISIIDSAGSTHEFQDLAITGATINNLGQIFGATVSVPVSSTGVGPWNVSTTLGSSTVSATAEAQELVIDGGLVSIQEL